MFSTTTIWIETEATGYVEVGVGFDAYVPGRRSGECAQLDEVVEVSVDGAPWISFNDLQAQGLRTLAHEIAVRLDDAIYDILDDLHADADSAADDYRYEQMSDRY